MWIEAIGKSLEEAIQTAAEELGVPGDELQYEVINESSKGFLGIGQTRVRIRAAIRGSESAAIFGEAGVSEIESSAESHPTVSASEYAVRMLQSVLQAMRFDARPVLKTYSEEEIVIDIVGAADDLGRLIGRHGQTLDALQYLVGIAVNRATSSRIRVLLDAEGYRERHRQMLEAKALDYARQVKETGNEAVLEPQSARDRRIIHLVLADNPDVCTYSEGEGEDRHVVISPRK